MPGDKGAFLTVGTAPWLLLLRPGVGLAFNLGVPAFLLSVGPDGLL